MRQLEQAEIDRLDVPRDFLVGLALARSVVHPDGRGLAECNAEIFELMEAIEEAKIERLETIYVNELDRP